MTGILPNPWDFSNRDQCLYSPNRSARVIYDNLKELFPGSPLSGKCYLLTKSTRQLLGGAFAGPPQWSDDSSHIAIPRWVSTYESNNLQKIYVLRIGDLAIAESFNEFRVVHLKSFTNDIIVGIDSPNYRTSRIELKISELKFSPFEIMDWIA